MLLTLTPWLVCVFWTPSNACSIFLQNKYKTTARLLSILIILVSFLDYDMDKKVEAGNHHRQGLKLPPDKAGFLSCLRKTITHSGISHLEW